MRGQAGFFDVDERLKEISARGDDLERLNAIVDFEAFRPDLAKTVPRSNGSRGGRPHFDHVFMWKVLILQASHSLSDERDRLSFMRFLGLGLSDPVPDANTIWTFREALTRATIGEAPAITVLFRAYEAALTKAGFLAMGGQIIYATIVSAPKQRNTDGEKDRHPGRSGPRGLEGQAGQARAEGSRCALDGKVLEGEAIRRRLAAHRHRRTCLRLQEPRCHRPASWSGPPPIREMHWHSSAEWAYVIAGRCQVTIVDPAGVMEIVNFGPGDIWSFPAGHAHAIQALGDKPDGGRKAV